jgi:hypothetical protein
MAGLYNRGKQSLEGAFGQMGFYGSRRPDQSGARDAADFSDQALGRISQGNDKEVFVQSARSTSDYYEESDDNSIHESEIRSTTPYQTPRQATVPGSLREDTAKPQNPGPQNTNFSQRPAIGGNPRRNVQPQSSSMGGRARGIAAYSQHHSHEGQPPSTNPYHRQPAMGSSSRGTVQRKSVVDGNSRRIAAIAQDSSHRDPTRIVIAVCGMTGTGKSTFISRVTEKQVAVGHGLQSGGHALAAKVCTY